MHYAGLNQVCTNIAEMFVFLFVIINMRLIKKFKDSVNTVKMAQKMVEVFNISVRKLRMMNTHHKSLKNLDLMKLENCVKVTLLWYVLEKNYGQNL